MAPEPEPTTSVHLLELVTLLQLQALRSLGKVADPATGETSRNLEQARFAIDLLQAVEEKTRGNLSPEESGHLTQVLTNLRLNFVDEATAAPAGAAGGQTGAGGAGGSSGESGAGGAAGSGAEGKAS